MGNQVKIPYELANGKVVWVEVSPQVRRAISAHNQRERRQNLDIFDNHTFDEFEDGIIERKSQEIMRRHDKEIQSLELREAIRQLSPVQRRRLTAYYFEGFTYQEIADMEGVSLQAIDNSLRKAIKRIKKSFCGG